MSVKPLFLDETGQEANTILKEIKEAILNTETVQQAKNEIQEEAERILATIPEDYTEMTKQVSSLSGEIEEYTDTKEIMFTDGYNINLAFYIGDVVDITPQPVSDYRYAIVDCVYNDVFVLNCSGGYSPRAYAFLDDENKLLEVSDVAVTLANKALIAPLGATKIIINDSKTNKKCYKGLNKNELHDLLYIEGVGNKSGGNSNVTSAGQYFFHSSDKVINKVTNFASATDFESKVLPTTKRPIILNNLLMQVVGNEINTLETTSIIYITGYGTKASGNTGIKGKGQFYVNSTDNKLKYCVNYTSESVFDDITLSFDTNALYVYKENFYKYSGANDFLGLELIANNDAVDNAIFESTSGNHSINRLGEDTICSFIRGFKFSDELKAPLTDFKKDGDLMVHVSSFCIINDVVYMTYYVNTRNASETPSQQTARFAYCNMSSMDNKTYIDLQDVGETYDGKTVAEIYDTILLRKDDDVLFLMWTAKLNGTYYRLYRTYTISTDTLSDIYYNNFFIGETGGKWNTTTMINSLNANNIAYKDITGDIGIMQKLSSRNENGTIYYYTGAYVGGFNCIVKSSDLINWYFVATPNFKNEAQWENATYVIGDKVYYFVRQYIEHNTGFLTYYDLVNKTWAKPVYINDCQSRADFIVRWNDLYLIHAPKDRNHISIMYVDKNNLNKSFEVQTAKVIDCFYPFVQIYNDELYMSFTQSREHIYLSKFTFGESNDRIMAKFKELFT